MTPKARRFWPLFLLVLLSFTLAYNPGAAMSGSLGAAHSGLGFALLGLAARVLLVLALHRGTDPGAAPLSAGGRRT